MIDRVYIDAVIEATCREFSVRERALRDSSIRARPYPDARAFAALLIREAGGSYPEIARAIGTRRKPLDHTSAITACRRARRSIETDAEFRTAANRIRGLAENAKIATGQVWLCATEPGWWWAKREGKWRVVEVERTSTGFLVVRGEPWRGAPAASTTAAEWIGPLKEPMQ